MALDLGKQVGPMPLGAWIIVVAGGLGIAIYSKNSANPAADYVADDTGTPDGVADGTVGGWDQTTGGSGTPVTAPAVITTNEEWAHVAIDWLIKQGYDASAAYSAITKAFLGEPLSITEYALWAAAIRGLGAPPFPVLVLPPSPLAGPVEPVEASTPAGAPRVVPVSSTPRVASPSPTEQQSAAARAARAIAALTPAQQASVTGPGSLGGQWDPSPWQQNQPGTFEYYTVKAPGLPGSTLKSISQIKYGRPDWWERIYNHNRAGTRRDDGTPGMIQNPNVLHTGWRLLIPR